MKSNRLEQDVAVFQGLMTHGLVTFEMLDALGDGHPFRTGMNIAQVREILTPMSRDRRTYLVGQLEALSDLKLETV